MSVMVGKKDLTRTWLRENRFSLPAHWGWRDEPIGESRQVRVKRRGRFQARERTLRKRGHVTALLVRPRDRLCAQRRIWAWNTRSAILVFNPASGCVWFQQRWPHRMDIKCTWVAWIGTEVQRSSDWRRSGGFALRIRGVNASNL